ncbi:hypothetical protein NEAUS05_0610 [Nematocida ausubeli]|nr:hypothetical protein NEAUS06_0515 [Nematocida ausubeli]KAI5147297.1 hypothetical protein NEAUS05_0610 [Nematocida ausubeli]
MSLYSLNRPSIGLAVYIHINTSMLSTYLSILSFLCICLFCPLSLFLMPPCIFILLNIGEIKCIFPIVEQFILHRYKKRNKALETGKRRKVAHFREPSFVGNEKKNKKKIEGVTHYRQIENEANIYCHLRIHSLLLAVYCGYIGLWSQHRRIQIPLHLTQENSNKVGYTILARSAQNTGPILRMQNLDLSLRTSSFGSLIHTSIVSPGPSIQLYCTYHCSFYVHTNSILWTVYCIYWAPITLVCIVGLQQ